MSNTFLLSPNKSYKGLYKIAVEEYRAKLLDQWPDTAFMNVLSHSVMPLQWMLLPSWIDSSIHRDHVTISFSISGGNEIDDVIDFILWHRRYIPAEIPLELIDTSTSNELLLMPDTTRQTILDFIYEN